MKDEKRPVRGCVGGLYKRLRRPAALPSGGCLRVILWVKFSPKGLDQIRILGYGKIMEQLYFLSILFNGLVGFLFIFEGAKEDSTDEGGKKLSFLGDGLRLVLGIVTGITGILKLLLPIGLPIPILGDLLPAVAGIAAGFMLIFGFYRERAAKSEEEGKFDAFGETLLHYRKIAGIVLLATSVLHFLFFKALFL